MLKNTLRPIDVLKFFRDVEFFNPFDLERVKELYKDIIYEINSQQAVLLPWESPELYGLDPEYEYNYDLYFGVFEKSEIQRVLSSYIPAIQYEAYSDDRELLGLSCFTRIRIDSSGRFIFEDMGVSSQPWALHYLVHNKKLSVAAFDSFCSDLVRFVCTKMIREDSQETELDGGVEGGSENRYRKITYLDILSFSSFFNEESLFSISPLGVEAYLIVRKMRKRKQPCSANLKDEVVPSDRDIIYRKCDILNSFYIRDLEKLSEKLSQDNTVNVFSRPLCSYFKGIFETEFVRQDLIEVPPEISGLPLGRWPNSHNVDLSYNQKFVLDRFFNSNDSLIAVNGPPGTGKSFIVKDVLSKLVIKRAYMLSQFERPEGVFRSSSTELTISQANLKFRCLKEELTGYELVLASTNNTSVNNISKELPFKKSIDKEFHDFKFLGSTAWLYFRDLFLDEESGQIDEQGIKDAVWGLPSVALGKKVNRLKFVNSYIYAPREEEKKIKEQRLQADVRSILEWRKVAPKDAKSYRKQRQEFIELYEKLAQENQNKNNVELLDQSLLFLKALSLHEAWLREVPRIEQELVCISQLLRSPLQFDEDSTRELWKILFMIVPMISTTLASVERQFVKCPSETFGNVIIDESGQASVQSVMGMLSRAKKALILGDQRQLEPICQLPLNLVYTLGDHLPDDIYDRVSPHLSSAQSIADRQYEFGTALRDLHSKSKDQNSSNLWVGIPLLEHRRCLDPMFSISNDIAYNGIMKFCTDLDTNADSDNALPESCWYDVSGECMGKQWVPQQGLALSSLCRDLFFNFQELPDIFFISPFREVVQKLKTTLQKAFKDAGFKKEQRLGVTKRIGTVHAFQGKEADLVFFVLGCDHSRVGAAEWAGAKPNLINVAITRARKRLYVIGDRNVWHNKGYFSDLEKGLKVKKVII